MCLRYSDHIELTRDLCRRNFTKKRSLKRHHATCHSLAARFFCLVAECKYHKQGFRRSDYLTKHRKKKHL